MRRRTSKARTLPKPTPGVRISELLECGHPGAPNNLIDGKCGTCEQMRNVEKMAKESHPKIKPLLLKLAELFRNGDIVYDTDGKSLLEWEKTMSPQSNAAMKDGESNAGKSGEADSRRSLPSNS